MMQRIFKTLEQTLDKSAINDFRIFINNLGNVTKWFMCSDYCIDDKEKPNDVVTFVLYPYIRDFNEWSQLINRLQKTDLKKCRKVSKDFCHFSHSGDFFSFSFIISKDSYLSKWKESTSLKTAINSYIDMINNQWKTSTPHNIDHYNYLISRLKKLTTKMDRANFNYKLLSRIMIVIFLASYLKYLLIRENINIDIFSWISDRDKITSFCSSIYEDLYEITSHCLCFNTLPEEKYASVKEVIPADIESGIFDEINRVADFICGGIADQNLETGHVHKQKHCTLIEDVIADNPNIVILNIGANSISKISHKKIKI